MTLSFWTCAGRIRAQSRPSTVYIRPEAPRCLIYAFEASREQLFRSASGWGINFDKMEQDGQAESSVRVPGKSPGLKIIDHNESTIHEFQLNRVAVDSLSALERVSTIKGVREFVIGLTA